MSASSLTIAEELGPAARALADSGVVRLDAAATLRQLSEEARACWDSFVKAWDDLGPDLFMADGGKYRRRRHAVFVNSDGHFVRQPHRPHFQSRKFNPLNGDVERWFEPVLPATSDHPVTRELFALCNAVLTRVAQGERKAPWNVEFHQFRIETSPHHVGRPTPEGLHRDGVDWVFVLLVARENVREGITEIGGPDSQVRSSFVLREAGDAIFLDDRRVLHGVTEIHAIDPSLPAYRDVLVVTFAR